MTSKKKEALDKLRDVNYNRLKELQIKQLSMVYPKKYVEIYEHYISKKYDNLKQTYLDSRLMWRLFDDHLQLRQDNILFYAIVGLGGSGKTTLGCNMAYFHDSKVDGTSICWGFEDMVKRFDDWRDNKGEMEKRRALIIDEPNEVPNPTSSKGKALAEILGQLRQVNPIIIFCSTDMKDIPPTAFRKLKCILYIKSRGTAVYIRDDPYRDQYYLSDLKKMYLQKGYKAFKDLISKTNYPFLKVNCMKNNIIQDTDPNFNLTYYRDKRKALDSSVKTFINGKKAIPKSRKPKIIELHNQGMKNNDIARELQITIGYVKDTIREMRVLKGR